MAWAIVTGGSRGIGAASCLALASAGFDVSFTWRSDERAAQALCEQVSATGRQCRSDQVDAGDLPALARWAADTAGDLAPQALVVNAAETLRATLAEHEPDAVRRIFDVNVVATIELARVFAPALGASAHGAIVTVSSMNALRGSAGSVAYTASKAAVLGLTRALAIELAPEVRVNAVVPGIVDTDMNAAPLSDPEIMASVQRAIPLGRAGTPDEVGRVIAWLAGPESSYVTGAAVPADGGGLAVFPVH